MRYVYFFLLIGFLGIIVFTNALTASKHQLVSFVFKPSFESYAPTVKKNGRHQFVVAKLYSTYPFNHRNVISISAGRDDGVEVGMPVTVYGQTLLGKITEVAEHYSVAQTLFDSSWSLPVRIGNQEIDALLVGGSRPRLTTIDKKYNVAQGDHVYAASREAPYGLEIGIVEGVADASRGTFQEASLLFAYNLNDIKDIWVLLK